MPGQGRIVERAYTPDEKSAMGDSIPMLGETTFDVYLNDRAFWRNVPAAVWTYKLGGYQVLKKWLSYRERSRPRPSPQTRRSPTLHRHRKAYWSNDHYNEHNYPECLLKHPIRLGMVSTRQVLQFMPGCVHNKNSLSSHVEMGFQWSRIVRLMLILCLHLLNFCASNSNSGRKDC